MPYFKEIQKKSLPTHFRFDGGDDDDVDDDVTWRRGEETIQNRALVVISMLGLHDYSYIFIFLVLCYTHAFNINIPVISSKGTWVFLPKHI